MPTKEDYEKVYVVNRQATLVDVQGSTGSYQSLVSMTQNVSIDAGNTSTANLAAGATFTGTKNSTLGIVGIQVMLKCNEPCMVFIDQTGNGTNYDMVDSYL